MFWHHFFCIHILRHHLNSQFLHPKSNGFFLSFFEKYETYHEFEFSSNSFMLAFQHISHLSISGPFGMVFKHLSNCFHPKDSKHGFRWLFQLCFHITQGHIPRWIAHVLGAAHLLAMTKLSSRISPIVMGKMLYWFTSYISCLKFHGAFGTHFLYTSLELQPRVHVK